MALAVLVSVVLPSGKSAYSQTTLHGGVSTYPPTVPQIYAGQDPLKGKAEMMPPNSRGDCAPPDPGWILLHQSETTCYYFAPFKVPLQGQVLTPQDAAPYQ